MTDKFTRLKRSEIMSKIGPKNSSQEILVRKVLFKLGFRFLLHRKDLPGKPDIVLPRYKKIIMVNGCFWHGHKGCKRSILPVSNHEFWKKKIESNMKRDMDNIKKLKDLGWKHLIIWQCKLGKMKDQDLENKLIKFIKS